MIMQSRRQVMKYAAASLPFLAGMCRKIPHFYGTEASTALAGTSTETLLRNAPKARYWTSVKLAGSDCLKCHVSLEELRGKSPRHAEGVVKCLLCAQTCVIPLGQRGKCRARMNVNGELRSLVYGRPMAIHIDPIEKKPFYHFLPGSNAFSLATSGCPLRCRFCQNWQLSQASPEDYDTDYFMPPDLVSAAEKKKVPTMAFTYNEATVFTEYFTDIAREARKKKLRAVLISCGFMNEAPLTEMCEVLDAIKIDLKGFSEDFYRNVSSAQLKPVLRSIKQIRKSGIHLELVNLVVPTLNDSDQMLKELTDWVMGELGPDVPIHFTRFHPDFQLLNLSPTPVTTLERARNLAMSKGIHYAYVGNVPEHPGNHTYCPNCKNLIVRRNGFFISEMKVSKGECQICHHKISGVWV
jgi:pyruvate formate lyase activating enzyme